MSNDKEGCFSSSYNEARTKFLSAVKDSGLSVVSHIHPDRKGPENEDLAIDVAEIIPPNATKLIVITSGLHGIEGYAGSAVQIEALTKKFFSALPEDTGIVLVHSLNPWGMAHYSRTDENNVDNNRNFVSSFEPSSLPVQHPLTDAAHIAYVASPHDPEPKERFEREHGDKIFQAALSQGQYTNPEGLFYGGREPSFTNKTWHEIIGKYTNAGYLGLTHIDIHTGLGPRGYGELIVANPRDSANFKRAHAIWGDAVKSCADGTSASAALVGTIENSLPPEAISTTIEFGTVPVRKVLDALIAANQSFSDGFKGVVLRISAIDKMRNSFCPNDPEWVSSVVEQSFSTIQQAIDNFDNALALRLTDQRPQSDLLHKHKL